MKKIALICVIFLCLGCSERKSHSPKFTEEQIAQLSLNNVKPLQIYAENSTEIELKNFLSEKEISLTELIDSVEFIPLQTTKESLIAEVNKLVCVENYFFIFDSDIGKNVFIFSDDGTFIKKIPIGQGPEEIYNPADIAVDEEQNHLIVYNRKGLSFYDYHGNFVKREPLPFNFKNFRVLPNGFLFITVSNRNDHMEEISEMQVLITDKNFRIITAGLPFHYSNTLNYGTTDYTSSFETKVNFSFKFYDKVYQYLDTISIQEKYRLNFSNKGLPFRYLEMNTSEVLKILKDNDYYFFMGEFLENNTHECFILYNHNKKGFKTLIFRDKLSRKLRGGNKILLDGDIPLFSFPLASHKNEFIGTINSYAIHNYLSNMGKGKEKNTVFTGIDDDSNPIIIKYKLKGIN